MAMDNKEQNIVEKSQSSHQKSGSDQIDNHWLIDDVVGNIPWSLSHQIALRWIPSQRRQRKHFGNKIYCENLDGRNGNRQAKDCAEK